MKLEERLRDYIQDLKWDIKESEKRIKRLKEQREIYGGSYPRIDYEELIAREEGIIETLKSIIDVEEDMLNEGSN